MVQGTRDLVEAAKAAGVKRLVLMSALGTEEGREVTPYYHAKWEEEQAVKYSGLEHVIFRPSFVFGAGRRHPGAADPDRPLLAGDPDPQRHRMQPIWVEDVAAFFTQPSRPGRRQPDVRPRRARPAHLGRAPRTHPQDARQAPPGVHDAPGLLKAGATVGQMLPPFHGARSAVEMLDLGDNVCDPQPAIEPSGSSRSASRSRSAAQQPPDAVPVYRAGMDPLYAVVAAAARQGGGRAHRRGEPAAEVLPMRPSRPAGRARGYSSSPGSTCFWRKAPPNAVSWNLTPTGSRASRHVRVALRADSGRVHLRGPLGRGSDRQARLARRAPAHRRHGPSGRPDALPRPPGLAPQKETGGPKAPRR